MIYSIFKEGVLINRIVSDLEYVEQYCLDSGCTYEKYIPEPEPEPEPIPTDHEILMTLLGVTE